MQIHEVINLTSHRAALAFAQDTEAADVAVALLKASYSFSYDGALVSAAKESQLPVCLADSYAEGPEGRKCLRYATDVVADKPGTDVVVVGCVYARGSPRVVAGFRIGALEKAVVAHGPRVRQSALGQKSLSQPVAFEKVEASYANAYGGVTVDAAGNEIAHPSNAAGKGFHSAGPRDDVPSLEYRGKPYPGPGKSDFEPAALGFVPAGWRQRSRFAGTFDERWTVDRRPLLPEDFDGRFFNAVPQDQVLHPKLTGGESLVLSNLHPQAHVVRLTVPREQYVAEFLVRGRAHRVPMVVDTLLVMPDEDLLALTFRAAMPLREDIRYVRSVTIREGPGVSSTDVAGTANGR